MADRHEEEGTELMRKAAKVLAGLRGRMLRRRPDWGAEAEPSLPPPPLWGTMRRANGRRRRADPEKLLARMGSFASTSASPGGGMEEDGDREEKLKAAMDEITTGAAPSEMSSPDTPLDFAAAATGFDADASSSGEGGGDNGCARADGGCTGQSVADRVELQEAKKTPSDRDNNRGEKGCLLFDLNEDAPLEED